MTSSFCACAQGSGSQAASAAYETTTPEPQEPVDAMRTTETIIEQGRSASALAVSAAALYRQQIPGILADQTGYAADERKFAVFCGERLPAVFEVRDDETDETVFTGELRPAGEDGTRGLGDFSELTEPGRYYLYAQYLGESYPFSVDQGMYEKLLQRILRRYYLNRCGVALTQEYAGEDAHSVCHTLEAHLEGDDSVTLDVIGGWHMDGRADRFVNSGAEIVLNLLLAWELNGAAFGDDTGIPESGNEVPDVLDEVKLGVGWLLKMQDEETGGVYAAAVTTGVQEGQSNAPVEIRPVSEEATILFAAALAKFGYVFREYDGELSELCLEAAERAFSWYTGRQGEKASDAAYAAAAELYRASGEESSRALITRFFEEDDFCERMVTEPLLLMGTVTYLRTEGQEVDREMCGALIRALTVAAEEAADASNRSVYGAEFPEDEKDTETVDRLLRSMCVLAVADRISYSYEYTRLLSEYLHALCGRCPGAKDYLTGFSEDPDDGGYPGILGQPVQNAQLAIPMAMLLPGESE